MHSEYSVCDARVKHNFNEFTSTSKMRNIEIVSWFWGNVRVRYRYESRRYRREQFSSERSPKNWVKENCNQRECEYAQNIIHLSINLISLNPSHRTEPDESTANTEKVKLRCMREKGHRGVKRAENWVTIYKTEWLRNNENSQRNNNDWQFCE